MSINGNEKVIVPVYHHQDQNLSHQISSQQQQQQQQQRQYQQQQQHLNIYNNTNSLPILGNTYERRPQLVSNPSLPSSANSQSISQYPATVLRWDSQSHKGHHNQYTALSSRSNGQNDS